MVHSGENIVDGVPVEVVRKRVRRISIRVKSDGRVAVSVPKWGATLAEAEAFLRSKWRWVLKVRAEALARPPSAADTPPTEAELSALSARLGELMARWAARLAEPGVTWRLRAMKTLWGSCHIVRRRITYNRDLAKVPRELVEYVVVHELTHLKAANTASGVRGGCAARTHSAGRVRLRPGDVATGGIWYNYAMKLVKSCLVATVAAAALCAIADVSKFDSRIAADTAMASADGMVWVDAAKLPMESKVCPDTETPFGRIPAALAEKVPQSVRAMGRNSTGHYFFLETDSPKIGVRWECEQKSHQDPYIPRQGMYGVDIYARGADGWRFVKNGRLGSVTDEATGKPAAWDETRADLPGSGVRQVLVYLPIRANLKWVRIGVASGSKLAPARHADGRSKPVVHYGTSLVHGGCASRPGLVFTALAARALDVPYVNLGFSGSARLEIEMADVMALSDAALYVVDTVWNCDERIIRERAKPFLERLHALRPEVPILLCEGPEAAGRRLGTNDALKGVYEEMKSAGALGGKLHYLPCGGMLPADGEATHDYIHPNDYGSVQMGRVFAKRIAELLK